MSAPTQSPQAPESGQQRGVYTYCIVPADVEVTSDAQGIGDPPSKVTVVRHKDIAALVSEIDLGRPLGTPDDLVAHEDLLDATAAAVPVLPVRFGAVLTDTDAVVEEFLAPYHDEFVAALKELEGLAEYLVRGRYQDQALMREILSEDPQIAQLRDAISGKPEEATRNERIAIGERINYAVEAKRTSDTQALVEALTPYAVKVIVREPTHEMDAAHLAILAETDREADLEGALEDAASDWAGRVKLSLRGPLAPYDFVTTAQPQG